MKLSLARTKVGPDRLPNRTARVGLRSVLACLLTLIGLGLSAPAWSATPPSPAAFTKLMTSLFNPDGRQLLTTSASEITSSAQYGFTVQVTEKAKVATSADTGLVAIQRTYNGGTHEFRWVPQGTALAAGFAVQKVEFYASLEAFTGSIPVYQLSKSSKQRLAFGDDDRTAQVKAGWTGNAVLFNVASATAAPPEPVPPTGSPFTIAVIGDTQNETNNAADTRYPTRTQWIADNKSQLNLAYVLHTGDNVNWGWLVPSQYDNAKKAIAKLTNAGIPFSLTIGNHDTRAVGWNGVAGSTGYGGSAYEGNPECPSRLQVATCRGLTPKLVRQTDEFNAAFPLSIEQNLGGSFESNKIDNTWTTFTASGTKWLVLTLELWPRTAVIDWAENVVKNHADYNVIIQTHSYLDGTASISPSNGGYGANAPTVLRDRIIAKYPNVKLVFSGHTGGYSKRSDNYNGNTVVAYLGNELGGGFDPVRLITIDPATGIVTGRVYNPMGHANVSGQDTSDTIRIVR